MSFKDLSYARFSCRNYSPKAIPADLLSDVLEAARLAPSACNRQPWRFYVISDPAVKAKVLSKSKPAFLDAPVVIAAVGIHDEAWHRPADGKDHTDVDVAIAVEHMCLAATACGLASCWVCSFDTVATKEALALSDGEEPIALLPLGFAAEGVCAPEKSRKSLDAILKWI